MTRYHKMLFCGNTVHSKCCITRSVIGVSYPEFRNLWADTAKAFQSLYNITVVNEIDFLSVSHTFFMDNSSCVEKVISIDFILDLLLLAFFQASRIISNINHTIASGYTYYIRIASKFLVEYAVCVCVLLLTFVRHN